MSKMLFAPLRYLYYFMVLIFSLWVSFFLVYLLVPERFTEALSEEFSYALDDNYRPILEALERFAREDRFEPGFIAFGEVVIDISMVACYSRSASADTGMSLQMAANTLNTRIISEKARAQHEMLRLQELSTRYSLTIVILGMVTTLFAGLNSSEFSQSGRKSASSIKIAAIFFPAAVTAVTATSSLVAGQDQIAKQTQIHYGLLLLGSEITSQLIATNCPVPAEQVPVFLTSMSEWNRRVTDIVAGANMPSSRTPGASVADDNRGDNDV